jgi:hypothetical protein
LYVIQNGQAENRRRFEDGQAEVRLLITQLQAEGRRLMEEGQVEICQRFDAVEQSTRGEIVDVSTRVDDVSDHINVGADQVDRIAEHVSTVNGCLGNVVNRLQKLEYSQNVSSSEGSRQNATGLPVHPSLVSRSSEGVVSRQPPSTTQLQMLRGCQVTILA